MIFVPLLIKSVVMKKSNEVQQKWHFLRNIQTHPWHSCLSWQLSFLRDLQLCSSWPARHQRKIHSLYSCSLCWPYSSRGSAAGLVSVFCTENVEPRNCTREPTATVWGKKTANKEVIEICINMSTHNITLKSWLK